MIKIYFLPVAGIILALASCGLSPVANTGGATTTVHEVYMTNIIPQIETNSADNAVDTNAMQFMTGEWMVIQETYLTVTNFFDVNGDLISNHEFVATNSYESLSNNGNGGAYSFVFNADGTVDNIIYDNDGNPTNTDEGNYLFQVMTNQYGSRLELVVPDTINEVRWWEAEGDRETVNEPFEYTCFVTNYSKNYRVIEAYPTNFSTFMPVIQVKSWVLHIEKTMNIDSYAFSMDTNLMTISLDPDSVYLNTLTRNRGQARSSRTVYENAVVNNGSVEISSRIFFNTADDTRYVLKKIR